VFPRKQRNAFESAPEHFALGVYQSCSYSLRKIFRSREPCIRTWLRRDGDLSSVFPVAVSASAMPKSTREPIRASAPGDANYATRVQLFSQPLFADITSSQEKRNCA
jgi:hypothetical protein